MKITSLTGKTFAFAGLISMNIAGYNQSVRYPLAARYAGMGAYSRDFVDALSVTSNQGAIPAVKQISAGIYAERRFLLKELSLYTAVVCMPFQFGGIAASAKYFGYKEYNETQLSIGYGKSLGKIGIGIQFNYHSVAAGVYGKKSSLNFEVGAIMHITEQVFAGFHIFNPAGSKFGNEKIASVYSGGLGYQASEKVFASAEFIKEEDRPVNVNAGLQYALEKKLFARVGLYTGTANLYFGIGFKWSSYRIDVTASYHPQLGFTPGLMLVFERTPPSE
jgi:hypothetical protein